MNSIRKYLGIIWMLLAPTLLFFLVKIALHQVAIKPGIDTIIQWSVFLIVFIPIDVGLFIFGLYAWRGAYNNRM